MVKQHDDDARAELAGHIASLDVVDRYGIPPLGAYQQFNSVGADLHGQCAMAQGAKGYAVSLSASFDFAKLLCPGAPVSLKAGAGIGGVRLPTSAVVLYRFPSEQTAKGASRLPIGLAQMDGVSWEGKGNLNAGAGAGTGKIDAESDPAISLLQVAGGLNISVAANADLSFNTTKLIAADTHHFANAARADLVETVDKMLAVEIKKACIAIVAANKGSLFDTAVTAAEAIKAVGTTGLALTDAASQGEIKKAKTSVETSLKKKGTATGSAALADIKKGEGWGWILGGVAVVGAGAAGITAAIFKRKSIKKAVMGFLEDSDKTVLEDLTELQQIIETRFRALDAKKAKGSLSKDEQGEYDDALEALSRIVGFRNALFRKGLSADHVFLSEMPNPKPVGRLPGPAKVDERHLTRKGGSQVTLTSFNYGIKGDLDAGATLLTGNVSGHADTGLMGRLINFRFRMQGANDVALIQDCHANFFQMSLTAALNAGFLRTGISKLDEATKADLTAEKKASATSPGFRRFGALTYRAASVYVDVQTDRVLAALSGISQGVSIRTARLCSYADAVRTLDENTPAPSKDIGQFETWVAHHLGIQPGPLRAFIKDAPLGRDYLPQDDAEHGHKIGYPMDALLLEANFVSAEMAPLTDAKSDDQSLFDVHKWQGRTKFQQEVAAGQRTLAALRLRYRIQSPISRTSKFGIPLGLPTLGVSPLSLNAKFEWQTEVGHESIVDLHTQFNDRIEARAPTEHDKYEAVLPAVVLFNRA